MQKAPGFSRGPVRDFGGSESPKSACGKADGRIGGIGLRVILDAAGVHQPRRKQRQSGGKHQLRVDAHELGDPDGRLLGLLQVM